MEPEQLEAFEECWETYVDTQLLGTDAELETAEIGKHIMLAVDILERIDHSKGLSLSARKIVDGNSGLRIIINRPDRWQHPTQR